MKDIIKEYNKSHNYKDEFLIYEHYKKIINNLINKRFKFFNCNTLYKDDLFSYVNSFFYKIVSNYDEKRGTVDAYFYKCIKSIILGFIKKIHCGRYFDFWIARIENNLDDYKEKQNRYSDEEFIWHEKLKNVKRINLYNRDYYELRKKLIKVLSPIEYEVFVCYEDNIHNKKNKYSYTKLLIEKGWNLKKIDNAIQRIRKKASLCQTDFYETNKKSIYIRKQKNHTFV